MSEARIYPCIYSTMLADLLDGAALRLSISKNEIDVVARPVVPPSYREKTTDRITQIRETPRPKLRGQDIGLKDNREAQDVGIGVQNILAVYDQATPEELDFWSGWYIKANRDVKALADDLGVPFDLMAAVVAIMSPGNKWGMNLRAAARAVQLAEKAMDDPERHQIEQQIETLRSQPGSKKQIDELVKRYGELSKKHAHQINGYPANIRKAINVLQSEDPTKWVTGPKVSKFYQAIVNPHEIENEMVLDGHAINVFDGVRQNLKLAGPAEGERRKKMLQAYAEAAKARNTNTRAVQAVTWFIFKSLLTSKKES